MIAITKTKEEAVELAKKMIHKNNVNLRRLNLFGVIDRYETCDCGFNKAVEVTLVNVAQTIRYCEKCNDGV